MMTGYEPMDPEAHAAECVRRARLDGAPYVPMSVSALEALIELARAGARVIHSPGRPWTVQEIAAAFPHPGGRQRSRTSATLMITSGFFGEPFTEGGPFKQGNRWLVPDDSARAKLAAPAPPVDVAVGAGPAEPSGVTFSPNGEKGAAAPRATAPRSLTPVSDTLAQRATRHPSHRRSR